MSNDETPTPRRARGRRPSSGEPRTEMGQVPDNPRDPSTGRRPASTTPIDGIPVAAMPEKFTASMMKPRAGEERLEREDVAYVLLTRLGSSRAANQARGIRWNQNQDFNFGFRELLDTTVNKQDREMLDLAWEIIDRLPEETHYESIINRMDLRPMIYPLIASQVQILEGQVPDAVRVGDAVIRGKTRVRLAEVFQEFDRQERENAIALADFDDDPTVTRDDQLEATRELAAMPETPGEVRPTLASAFADRARAEEEREQRGLTEAEAKELGLGPDDFTTHIMTSQRDYGIKLKTGANTDQWKSEEELRFLVAADGITLPVIMQYEANKEQARRELGPDSDPDAVPGDMEVNLGLDLRERLTDEQYEAYLAMSDTTRPREPLRYLDAVNYISQGNLTGAQIRNIQNHLVDAGYIDKPDWWGDSTDAKTINAWRRLMDESYASGRSFTDILARRRAQNMDKKAEDEFSRVYTLTDSAALRRATDVIGEKLLGRRLTDDERTRYIEAIHGYETDWAKSHDAKVRDEKGGLLEDVDVNARIEEMMMNDHSVESEAFGALQQFAIFDDIARRPG
jgi:hypothetical protein